MTTIYKCDYCLLRTPAESLPEGWVWIGAFQKWLCPNCAKPVTPKTTVNCHHCKAELEGIIEVCEETNLYIITPQDDHEFWETRSSDVVEYLCPKCFGVLNTETITARLAQNK